MAESVERGAGPPIRIFGRLATGVTFEEARAELTAIGSRAAAAFPASNEDLRPRIMPYAESIVGPMPLAIYGIQAFLAMLLVVACANVATLVFARTAMRESEIVVRSALGASRGRIIIPRASPASSRSRVTIRRPRRRFR